MAKNLAQSDGNILSVVCTHPTTPTSGAQVRFGSVTGVALTDESGGQNATGYTTVDFGTRVWNMVVDDNESGGIAVGDPVYYHDSGTGTGSVNLNNSATGANALFGFALEVVVSNATTLIKVAHVAYGFSTATTGTVIAGQIASNAVITAKINDAAVTLAKLDPTAKRQTVRLGSVTAVASNGANAILSDPVFVAPAALKLVAAYAINLTASDVTKGTDTSGTSYRRMTLIANTGGAGSGTTIVASLNATASAASKVVRNFATTSDAASIPAGAVILASHLTVGAASADATDMADRVVEIEYELL